MAVGEEALVLATVAPVRARRTRQGRALVELDVDDGTGALRVDVLQPGVAGASSSPWAPRRCSSASSTTTGAAAR